MQSSMESRILTGRPFGGTGFIWTRTLSSSIKTRCEYSHDRVTVLEISSNIGSILIINVYMPFFDNSNIESKAELYSDILGFIDSVIDDNSHSSIILMGDMNCDFYICSNQFSVLLNNFIEQRNLHCTFDYISTFDKDQSFTRYNLKLKSFSLLDYVFVSSNLIPYINDVTILNSGDILSDHIPVKISLNVNVEMAHVPQRQIPSVINWKAVDELTRNRYETVMDECLDKVSIPHILHGDHVCNDSLHILAIEKYYNDLLQCLQISDLQLPHCKPTTKKLYWNAELSALKNDSIVAHDFWIINGSPRTGPIFEAKKHAYYKYKLSIRSDRMIHDQERIDSLNEDLLQGNHCKFWKSFKYFNCSKVSQSARINSLNEDAAIADCFASNYSRVYESTDKVQSAKLDEQFRLLYDKYHSEHANDSINSLYLSWSEILDMFSKLESGKATSSFVKPEHILYGSPRFARHIHILFNAMIQHSYVPHEFLNGSISPLLKDSKGDHTVPDNYRPLTLSVIFSNLFEHALFGKIGHLLNTDSLQFGYKKRHSTSHAIHTLKCTVDYFTSRGSNVFAAFLDCSKGFDKVNHSGLFQKMIQRKVPLCILNLLIYWYSNLTSVVKWNGSYSYSFPVKSGVRQGGVLSPHLFSLYVDDLIISLRKLYVGCHIVDLFVACIVYADDICLLAPSRSALQLMLDTCESYGINWCLSYNPTKSKIMLFGKQTVNPRFSMYGSPLDFAIEYNYLGVIVTAGKTFSTSHLKPLIRFRSAANTVLNIQRKPSEIVLMKLLYSSCVPTMTYACEAVGYTTKQINSLNVALNNCIRRIFSYNRWESVRYLGLSMGYPSYTDILNRRHTNFMENIPLVGNSTLLSLSNLVLD